MKYILLLVTLTLSASCDLFMSSDSEDSTGFTLPGTCELDTKRFSDIFTQNIKGEILCLEQKLEQFLELVKTERPGYISQKTLKKVIENGLIAGIDQDAIDLIDGIFELAYLLFGGDKGFIAKKDMGNVIDILISFNQNILPRIYKYFNSDEVVSFARHEKERKEVFADFTRIAQEIERIINLDRGGRVDRIDPYYFVEKFFSSSDSNAKEKVSSLVFIKKTFLGGRVDELNQYDLLEMIRKIPELGLIAFDFSRIPNFEFEGDLRQMISIYKGDIKLIRRSLYYSSEDSEDLFTTGNLYSALDTLTPKFMETINLRKYPREIEELKDKFFQTNSGRHITSNQVVSLLNMVEDLLNEGEFIYKVFDHPKYSKVLAKTDPIPLTESFSNVVVRNSQEMEFRDRFARIVQKYRFLKGSNSLAYFGFNYQRSPSAVFEIAALETGVRLVMRSYGTESELARGGYHMTLNQTISLIDSIKRILRDQGITPVGRINGNEHVSTANNLVLMSTLFQNQSDGCQDKVGGPCMEVPEITEFLVGLVTALTIKDFFIEVMQSDDLCGKEVDEHNRIYVDCFRKNFMKALDKPIMVKDGEDEDGETIWVVKDGLAIKDYMPQLYSYLEELTEGYDKPEESEDYVKFLRETEEFTRTCSFMDESRREVALPMKGEDAFAVFAGLLNVESTLLRFDVNKNNQMDAPKKGRNEVLNAYYETYEGAIEGLVAPNGGFMAKLAKPIFQYLVKYGKVPDTSKFSSIFQFAKFLLKINKRAPATRTTIATILKTLGEENTTTAEDVYDPNVCPTSENCTGPFKCLDCMSDPTVECEPEGRAGNYPWDYDWNNYPI